jgi:hypothetical protein
VCIRLLGSCDDVLPRGSREPIRDVLSHSGCEQPGVLGN